MDRGAPSGLSAGAFGYGAGGPRWRDANRRRQPPTPIELVDAYKAIAYACIGLNAKGVAKVPLRLYAVRRGGQAAPRRSYRRAPDKAQRLIRGLSDRGPVDTGLARAIDTHDEIDEILDHPFLEAIQKPNPYFDRETLITYLVVCLDAVGASFFYPERPPGEDGYGDPTFASNRIWPLQPQYIFPVKGGGPNLIDKWRYFSDSFGPNELVRIRHVSLRDPYLSQYAPLHACYEQTGLVDHYTASVEGILRGGARPEVVLTTKDNNYRLGDDARERYELDINSKFAPGSGRRVWIVDGAFDAHTLSFSPVDLGGLELTKEQRLLAANCFDVPISLLQLEDSNRATAQESTHQHQYYSIDPRCRLIAAALTSYWAQPVDDRLFFFFDDPVTRDVEQDARVWAMRVEKGQATRNEWRANDGLPPDPDGDVILVPNNLVPLSAVVAGPSRADAGDAEKPDAGETAKPSAAGAQAAGDVQAQALNGAQISSLVEVIQNVRDGVIPPESAAALLAAAFPTLDQATIDRIVSPIEVKPAPEPTPALPPPAPEPRAEPDAEPPPAKRSALSGEYEGNRHAGDVDAAIVRVLGLLEARLSRGDEAPAGEGAGDDIGRSDGPVPE